MKIETFEHRFVQYVPAQLEPGVLYVSMDYATASHLCPCGCGSRVVTPLGPADWQLLFDGSVSLRPSIGNGQISCRSHYFILRDRVRWAPPMTQEQTRRAQRRDLAALAANAEGGHPVKRAFGPSAGPRSLWQRINAFLQARPFTRL